jgi:hypothetical protein
MRPRPKLEVLPPLLRQHDPATVDAFHEDRVRRDLARFAQAHGLFEQYVERARVRFQKTGERAILERWIEFYKSGERLIAARTAMERQKSEYLQLAREHEVRETEKSANLAKLQADIEEHVTRATKARTEREIEEATIKTRIDVINNPPKPAEPALQPMRPEVCRKKREEIDTQIDWVNTDADDRKKKYPDMAAFIENQRIDTLHQLEQERSKWLR